jgi:CheY-like chemotaxis protein
VKIYLPRLFVSERPEERQPSSPALPLGHGETILIVEDEPDVRSFTIDLMQELGYRTLDAPDGPSGLRMLDAHPEIELLFTDIGLPGGMNGRDLADAARQRRPDLKVLYASGYARSAIVHHGRLDPGVQLLTKPFTFAGLAARLRQVLDSA